MKRLVRIAVGGCALAAFALLAGTQAEAKCSRTKAAGWGVDKMMAMGMAKMSLDTSIALSGAKAKGKVQYKCTTPMFTECTASQRACS